MEKKTHRIRRLALATLASASFAFAGPQAMFGVSYTWGGGIGQGELGVGVKVITDNEEDKFIAAAGVNYYPFATDRKFGADLSAGYLFDSFALTAGWDFLREDFIVSAGYVNTVDDDSGSSDPASSPSATNDDGSSASNNDPEPSTGNGGGGASEPDSGTEPSPGGAT